MSTAEATDGVESVVTRWLLVADAAHQEPEKRELALNELLGIYRPVLLRYLLHHMALPLEEAEDLVQGFVADKILKSDLLQRADRGKGRFRSFLLKAFRNYAISALRRASADKRGPHGPEAVPLDLVANAASRGGGPEHAFQVDWARHVVGLTLERMQSECEAKERYDIWEVFQSRLVGPILQNRRPASYEQLVERFGFKSPAQAGNVLVTAKRMFRRCLREVVGDTLADADDVEDEIQGLLDILT